MSIGGVVFLIDKNYIISIKSISTQVIYLTLKSNSLYNIKIIEAYTPTTDVEEDVEAFYDDITHAQEDLPCYYNILIDKFNAKTGLQDDTETVLGGFGLVG